MNKLIYVLFLLTIFCSSCDTSHEFDIKKEGGIEYILEFSAHDFLVKASLGTKDQVFIESMKNIRENKSLQGNDFIKAFIQEYCFCI